MTRNEALNLLLRRQPKLINLLSKLEKWNTEIPLLQNAKNLNIPAISAYSIANKYKLCYKKAKVGPIAKTNKEAIQLLMRKGLSCSEIARLIGVSRQAIYLMVKK